MRVRLTVTPRIESPGPGSVDREAGANPARTRHCHRGSPPHACVASHWSVIGPGRRGRVGPGARRPPSDHKPEALVERGGSLHLQLRSAGLAAGLLTLALAPPALAGPTVTIRVEGKAKTMVEEQRLATPDAPAPTSTGTCNGNTALGALHQAVSGDWSGNGTYGTEFVERIRDENYPLG